MLLFLVLALLAAVSVVQAAAETNMACSDAAEVTTAQLTGKQFNWFLTNETSTYAAHHHVHLIHIVPATTDYYFIIMATPNIRIRVMRGEHCQNVVLASSNTRNALFSGFDALPLRQGELYTVEIGPGGGKWLSMGTDYTATLWEPVWSKLFACNLLLLLALNVYSCWQVGQSNDLEASLLGEGVEINPNLVVHTSELRAWKLSSMFCYAICHVLIGTSWTAIQGLPLGFACALVVHFTIGYGGSSRCAARAFALLLAMSICNCLILLQAIYKFALVRYTVQCQTFGCTLQSSLFLVTACVMLVAQIMVVPALAWFMRCTQVVTRAADRHNLHWDGEKSRALLMPNEVVLKL